MDTSMKPVLPNPQRGAWPLSQLFYVWIVPILWTGAKRGLAPADLTKCLSDDQSAELGDQLDAEWRRELQRAKVVTRDPKLTNALLRTFSRSIAPEGFLFFAATMIKTLLPFVLSQLLILFQHREPKTIIDSLGTTASPQSVPIVSQIGDAWQDKRVVGAALGISTIIFALFFHHAEMKQRMLGAKMRIACCSLIYRKTLRMSKLAASQTSAGYLVNLLSNDVGRLDVAFMYAHYIWILPLQASLVTYLIYRRIGWAAFVGVTGLLLKTMPVQTQLSRVLSRIRLRVALKTDERVGMMHEIVQGIQVIKMYAWEPFFRSTVLLARDRELKQIRYASYIRCFNLCTQIFSERTTVFLTILTCSLVGQSTTADVVFSMAQYFNVLQLTAAIFYPLSLALGGEGFVSITRIEELLLMEEQSVELQSTDTQSLEKYDKETLSLLAVIPEKHQLDNYQNAVELNQVSADWNPRSGIRTLIDVKFSVKSGSLCAVIGAVGSGKSSLLHLLLGELPIKSGTITLADGSKLSYASQEPWLFSGTVRDNILFGQQFNRQRYNKVVESCSLLRDFELLSHGDKTLVGERGSSLSGGQRARVGLARAVYTKASIYLLDDPLSAVDAHVGKHLFNNVIGPSGFLAHSKATRILVTHQVHLVQDADHIVVMDQGRVLMQGSYEELARNGAVDFSSLVKKSSEEPDEFVEDEVNDIVDMHFVGRLRSGSIISRCSMNSEKTIVSQLYEEAVEIQEEKSGNEPVLSVWWQYLRAGSNLFQLFYVISIVIFSQIVITNTDFYLIFWTNREDLRLTGELEIKTRFTDLGIFGGLLLFVILIVSIRGVAFFNMCIRTSSSLHLRMLDGLLFTPMRFFDTNPSGRILNRFSKDLGTIDETLPSAMVEALQTVLLIFGILGVVSILNPPMLLILAGSLVFFGSLLRLYLRPAQDLKRLEGITRSPVFSHLSASLNGISTIRSCRLEELLVREFDGLQDVHSAVWRLSAAANAALGLWLDILSALFILCVTFSFIYMFEGASSSNVGMALSQAMILTNYVQYGVRQTTLSLQQLTNVERGLEYTKLKKETQIDSKPPVDWPKTGNLRLTKMSLRYQADAQPTLTDLNLEVKSGWKVGIVGRTGAGKSSLISALFRLAIIDGSIVLDEIDTATIALKHLRSRISIIPQDPVLFSASIRSNLDPFNQFSDDELWKSLEAVELKSTIPMLDHMVNESGSNFSIGQRQLICLARAILRKDRVLVLDEATANVDPQTDSLIQRTIRERFVDSTVLTIAHRLRTVMDSDRIMVMDAGQIAEFDVPHLLLQNSEGAFSQMVKATGQEAECLRGIAAATFAKL